MTPERNARAGRALLLLFAISGFAGLIYESIWTQYLGLFLGHAAYAQSFVLVLFMGGMALGAWLVSRCSARIARPLAVYAVVEFAIGILGVAFDPIYHAATGFAYSHVFPLVGDGLALDVTRYAISILLIGAQCIGLGATFPLMSAGYLRVDAASGGRVLAGLYFSNSFGAALGALIATFVLLPNVGLPGTVLTGGLLSIFVAIAVWPLGREASATVEERAVVDTHAVTPWLVLVAAAITGATSFVYEITWIRMLALALGSTLHAFELMLAAFIAGIAFGGLWLRSRADRWADAVAGAGWAQVLMGVAALASLFAYAASFGWVASLMHGLSHTETGYTLYNIATGLIAAAVMFPAAFFAGMTLPLLTLILLRRGYGERAIGRVYAANTLGAIVGVLLTMHVLMPFLGVRLALWLAALGDLALGFVLLRRSTAAAPSYVLGAAVISLGVAAIAMQGSRVDPLTLASGVYRGGDVSLIDGTQMLYYGDGKTATVSLYQIPGANGQRSIATNGKVDAGIATTPGAAAVIDEYTMTLAAGLPLAALEHPKNVAVIGFGSGMTVNTFLGSDRVERVDVIEIEPFMVKAARGFGARVARAYTDPRANIVIDDAKAFLAGTERKYDVIVAEPSNPWVNGVAALFSDEFYDFVPKHLADGGVYVQWLQLYEITPDLVGSVLKAMLPHFSDVHAYLSNQYDMLLVATPHGRLAPFGDLETSDPRLAGEVRRLAMTRSEDLAQFSLLDRHGLAALAALSTLPANSDYFPILQLRAPQTRFTKAKSDEFADLQRSMLPLLEVVSGYAPRAASEPLHEVITDVPRDVATRAAREYREALLANRPVRSGQRDRNMTWRLDAMRASGRPCAEFDGRIWSDDSAFVAGATIPYLRAEDLAGVWIDPAWMPECAKADALARHAAELYAAVAARDWRRVADTGGALLESGDARGLVNFEPYVLRATELAHLALGDTAAVTAIENRYGGGTRTAAFERAFMMAQADIDARAPRAAQKAATAAVTSTD
jgi:predicted membrane-bound spermidine synthase